MLRLLHNLLLIPWLVFALALARISPMLVLFYVISPAYRVAGAALAVVVTVLLIHTVAAARSVAGRHAARLDEPEQVELLAVAKAARERSMPVPTCVIATDDQITAIRGWRWFIVAAPASAYADNPAGIVEAARKDLRNGTARLRPLIDAFYTAVRDWTSLFDRCLSLTRSGLSMRERRYAAPALITLPLVIIAYPVAQALRLITQVLLPGSERRAMAKTIEAPGTKPQTLYWNVGGRTIAACLIVFSGTYQGLGVLPAERIQWPWEDGPIIAQVTDVHYIEREDGLLGHLGVRHNSTWRPTVELPDGEPAYLSEGSTEVTVGESLTLVAYADNGRERYRHTEQTSITRYVVISSVMLLFAWVWVRLLVWLPVLAVRRKLFHEHDLPDVAPDWVMGQIARRQRPAGTFGDPTPRE